jgi:hypothetical protein
MKYTPDEYINSGFWDGDMDSEVQNPSAKVSKCRKPHKCCCGCGSEIQAGDYALVETGFLDGKPVRCYTSLICIDKWLDEMEDLLHAD